MSRQRNLVPSAFPLPLPERWERGCRQRVASQKNIYLGSLLFPLKSLISPCGTIFLFAGTIFCDWESRGQMKLQITNRNKGVALLHLNLALAWNIALTMD